MKGKICLAKNKHLDRITELLNTNPHLSLDGSVGGYNKKDVLEYINAKINMSLVYEIEGKIIAFIVAQFWKTYSYLHLIVVDKNYQGKGIGTLLINEIEKLAKKSGINCIESITEIDNKKMKRLFKKLNYKQKNKFVSFSKNLIQNEKSNI